MQQKTTPYFLKSLENSYSELQSKIDRTGIVEEKPTFTISPAPKLNFGMPISSPNTTNFKDMVKPTPVEPKKETGGFSLVPKANAMEEKDLIQTYLDDNNVNVQNREVVFEMLKDNVPKEIIEDAIINKAGYKGFTQEQPKEEGGFIKGGLDIGVKASEGISEFGKGLKFDTTKKLTGFAPVDELVNALKFAGNIPGDTIQLVGELGKMVSNPVGTAKDIETLAGGILEGGINKVLGTDIYTSEEKKAVIGGIKQSLQDNFGTFEKAKETIYQNPTDTLLALQGGLNIAKKGIKDPTKLAQIEKIEQAINPINILKTEAGAVGKVISKPVEKTGTLLKQSGEALYKTAIKPDVNEAELILRNKAGLGPKPITRADTSLKLGLTGTETQLGVKALQEADKIFKKTIGPALDKSDITHNIDDLFKKVETEILDGKGGELRKQELMKGLEALKEDYATIGKKDFLTKELQIEKSSLDEFTPQKVFKGVDVANGYNQVKNTLANVIRQQVRDDLGKLGVPNAKELYRDYANLTELSKIGIKGLTEGGLKGGFGTFWSTLYDKLATPIKTVGGKTLYKTGEGIEFLGPKGIKKVGDYLKINKIDIKDGNVINLSSKGFKNDSSTMNSSILSSNLNTGMGRNTINPQMLKPQANKPTMLKPKSITNDISNKPLQKTSKTGGKVLNKTKATKIPEIKKILEKPVQNLQNKEKSDIIKPLSDNKINMKEAVIKNEVGLDKISDESLKLINKFKNIDDYLDEINKLDGGYGKYRDSIAEMWRNRYIKPFDNINIPYNKKPIFSSNPSYFENSINDYYPEFKNLSLEEKINKIYGEDYSKLYSEMLDTSINDFRIGLFNKIKDSNLKPKKLNNANTTNTNNTAFNTTNKQANTKNTQNAIALTSKSNDKLLKASTTPKKIDRQKVKLLPQTTAPKKLVPKETPKQEVKKPVMLKESKPLVKKDPLDFIGNQTIKGKTEYLNKEINSLELKIKEWKSKGDTASLSKARKAEFKTIPELKNQLDISKNIENLTTSNIDDVAKSFTNDAQKLAKIKVVIREHIKKYGEKFKDYMAELVDNLADILGTRSKFMGNDGIGVDKTKLLKGSDDLIKEARKYKSADEFIKSQGLERIGAGRGRQVYDLGDGNVIKVAIDLKGKVQNIDEMKMQDYGFIPKIKAKGDDYIIMEKVNTPGYDNKKIEDVVRFFRKTNYDATNSELNNILYEAEKKFGLKGLSDFDAKDILFDDLMNVDNWGIKNGKLKIIDGGIFGKDTLKTEAQLKQIYEQATKPKLLKTSSVSKVSDDLKILKQDEIKNIRTNPKAKNQYISGDFKPLTDLDSDALYRAIGTYDFDNMPKQVTLYRGIKSNKDFDLFDGDFLTKNKKIAENFAGKTGKVKAFKVNTKDLIGSDFGYEEVIYKKTK